MDQQLLQQRNAMKKRKPAFIRQDAYKRKRLSDTWRSPRGLHSKLRYNKRGNAKKVSPGFKSPVAVRGLSRDGLVMHHVATVAALQKLDPKSDAVIISAAMGKKKKLLLFAQALQLGLQILNVKDAAGYKVTAEQQFAQRKQLKKKKQEAKAENEKETKKKAEEKNIEKLADEKTAEQKKEEENRQKQEILTAKND